MKYPGSVFLVENKPGASGNLGTDAVAKAAPDGATLGISIGGPLAINTLAVLEFAATIRRTDIAPDHAARHAAECAGGQSGAQGLILVAALVALIKANPGKYNFASIGNGSLSHHGDGGHRHQSRHQTGACALSGFAAGHHGGDPRRSRRWPACRRSR